MRPHGATFNKKGEKEKRTMPYFDDSEGLPRACRSYERRTTMKTMSSTDILRAYFGLKPGQKLAEFAAELKDLSTTDKKELVTLAAEALEVGIEDVTKA